MIKSLIVCTVVLCAANASFAGDGSPLSAKGAGEFTSFAGGYAAGIGNAGLAILKNGCLSRLNPATWSVLKNVQFSVLYDFSGVTSRDNRSNESSYLANGDFGGGVFAFPVDRSLGISIAAGFTPLTSYQYEINSAINATPTTPSATYLNTGSGGIGEAFVGASFSPLKELALGAMFNYAFGRTETIGKVTFSNTNYQGTYSDNSMYLRGSSGTFGFVVSHLDNLVKLNFLRGVNIAGYCKLPYSLNGSSQLTNTYSDGLDTSFTSLAYGRIPYEFGIGVSKDLNANLSAAFDIRTQNLSQYQDTFTPPGTFRNMLFIGGGVQYVRGKALESLYDRQVLRAGFYYEKTQYALPTSSGQNQQVNEFFLTAGVELPVSYTATVNVSAQYGLRGLSNSFPIQERVFRLYVTFTLGEIWFIRPIGG